MPRSGQHISTDTTFKGVKQFTQQAVWNLLDAHNAILEHRIEQTHYSNKCCKPSIKYQINDLVYLRVSYSCHEISKSTYLGLQQDT